MKKFNLDNINYYSIKDRKNLVSVENFGKLLENPKEIFELLIAMPGFLAANSLKTLVKEVFSASQNNTTVGVGLGGHVIKTGCSPYIIDLVQNGVISAIALNGAGFVHDFEISLIGESSEDVMASIADGSFGMAKETSEAFADICNAASTNNTTLGYEAGKLISNNKYSENSIISAAYEKNIPLTVHIALGTDITHAYPKLNPEALGNAVMNDYKEFINVVGNLQNGAWLNIGSAVILPEVFLKAISAVRNSGIQLDNLFTANLDMIQHYRPTQNVLKRISNRGVAITGHHEIMIPLIWACLKALTLNPMLINKL